MRDHTTMNEAAIQAWALHTTAQLARHITESVSKLLPDDLHALAAGLHVILEKTSPSGTSRAVRDFHVNAPADFETTSLRALGYYILNDLQDEIAEHLHHAWPLNDDGVALHAWASERNGVIELAFRGRGVNTNAAPIELPSFPVPPKPENAIIIG
jgi:hypothetical protein